MKAHVLRLRDSVLLAMESDERCRNNDTWLIFSILQNMGFELSVSYPDFRRMPSFEAITRCRRMIQAKGVLPPTDLDVKKKREAHRESMEKINKWWKE